MDRVQHAYCRPRPVSIVFDYPVEMLPKILLGANYVLSCGGRDIEGKDALKQLVASGMMCDGEFGEPEQRDYRDFRADPKRGGISVLTLTDDCARSILGPLVEEPSWNASFIDILDGVMAYGQRHHTRGSHMTMLFEATRASIVRNARGGVPLDPWPRFTPLSILLQHHAEIEFWTFGKPFLTITHTTKAPRHEASKVTSDTMQC